MSKSKVGLALGGGAARGLAHIGVLDVLEKEGIPVDMIAGTSIGALVGAVYAQKKGINFMKELAIKLGSKRFNFLADPTWPKTGLVRGKKIGEKLKSIVGNVEFNDLKMPFACVATDIDSGEEVVIKQGLVWEGIRASSSIPMLFSLVEREGRYLVDGGLVSPVPVSVLQTMGADFIIAVNVLSFGKSSKETKEHNIFNVMMKTISIYGYRVVESSLNGADIVIEPDVEHIAFTSFNKAEECINLGKLAAVNVISEIKKQLALN